MLYTYITPDMFLLVILRWAYICVDRNVFHILLTFLKGCQVCPVRNDRKKTVDDNMDLIEQG